MLNIDDISLGVNNNKIKLEKDQKDYDTKIMLNNNEDISKRTEEFKDTELAKLTLFHLSFNCTYFLDYYDEYLRLKEINIDSAINMSNKFDIIYFQYLEELNISIKDLFYKKFKKFYNIKIENFNNFKIVDTYMISDKTIYITKYQINLVSLLEQEGDYQFFLIEENKYLEENEDILLYQNLWYNKLVRENKNNFMGNCKNCPFQNICTNIKGE